MDDTTRRVNPDREFMGQADERARNLGDTPSATPVRHDVTGAMPPARRSTTRSKRATSTGSDLDPETDARTREIQAEIAETREELSETIDAIQDKLRPSNLVSEATDKVKTATTEKVKHMAESATETAQDVIRQTRDTASDVVSGARQNPIPALMIGVGVAWLLMDRSRDRGNGQATSRDRAWRAQDPRYRRLGGSSGYDRSPQVSAGASANIDTEYEHGWDDRSYTDELRHLGDRASDMADEARDTLRRTSRNAQNGLKRLLRDNPLLVGAAAVVAGAAVGAALPETERENEWMGETRDSLVDRAQEVAHNAASTVREVAEDAAEEVTERVTGEPIKRS